MSRTPQEGVSSSLAMGLRFNESGLDCVGISAGSSLFLGGFKVRRHTLNQWFANVKIKVRLFVAFGVLLTPQYQQKRRKLRKDNLRPSTFA
jgi:hypothetical protein